MTTDNRPRIVHLFRLDDPKPTAEEVLAELEELLDNAAACHHRAADLTRRTATPARELLAPIVRKLQGQDSV